MTVWTELCWEKLLSGTTSGVAIWLNYCLWCCLGMVFMKRAEFHVWIGHQWRSQRFYNSGGTWVYCPFPPQHKKKLPTPNEGRKKYCTRQKILRENKALTQRRNKTRWPNRTAITSHPAMPLTTVAVVVYKMSDVWLVFSESNCAIIVFQSSTCLNTIISSSTPLFSVYI